MSFAIIRTKALNPANQSQTINQKDHLFLKINGRSQLDHWPIHKFVILQAQSTRLIRHQSRIKNPINNLISYGWQNGFSDYFCKSFLLNRAVHSDNQLLWYSPNKRVERLSELKVMCLWGLS